MSEQKRILVVDDDVGVREYMEALLSRMGFSASGVANGEDVLGALEDRPADLVTLDLSLPGIGGFQVFALVKERWPDLPVLFLSGHGHARNIVEAMRLGAADFLRKPFDVEDLEKILAAIFDEAGRSHRCPTCSGTGRVSEQRPHR